MATPPSSGDTSELKNLILHKNDYDINRYKQNLIQNSFFIKTELEKYRNSKYPICYKSFNEIKTIPVYCYVHPSLAINQKETIILCHLGYILEKLASYKSMPEFNTQAMISFLNVTSQAQIGTSIDSWNLQDFRYEYEKLQKMYLSIRDKYKAKKIENKSLKEEYRELKETLKSMNQK